jgi:hypothetical protein
MVHQNCKIQGFRKKEADFGIWQEKYNIKPKKQARIQT